MQRYSPIWKHIDLFCSWLAPLLTARQPTQHSVINLLKKKRNTSDKPGILVMVGIWTKKRMGVNVIMLTRHVPLLATLNNCILWATNVAFDCSRQQCGPACSAYMVMMFVSSSTRTCLLLVAEPKSARYGWSNHASTAATLSAPCCVSSTDIYLQMYPFSCFLRMGC
jgi:hypothetical protein